jgi:crotonobetainyl-CoA:carnitine CoA-transferase CaiB-like acyl-CoA transferase
MHVTLKKARIIKEQNMGPLEGVKIIEFGGIGPGPFCAIEE